MTAADLRPRPGAGEARGQPGDEVVVTRLDHDANIRPWVRRRRRPGRPCAGSASTAATGELRRRGRRGAARPRAPGSSPSPARPTCSAPDRTCPRSPRRCTTRGALVFVDGVHLVAARAGGRGRARRRLLRLLAVQVLRAAPAASLAADPALLETLQPDKLLPSSDAVPERFELGTLPFELLAGTTAAVDFIAGLVTGGDRQPARPRPGVDGAVEAYEDALCAVPRVAAWQRSTASCCTVAPPSARRPCCSRCRAVTPPRSASCLARDGVNAPAGSLLRARGGPLDGSG